MFINIATENIILSDQEHLSLVPFHDVEQILTKICIDSYKKFLPDALYVLNGPGSFTNLRVGSLVVNLLLLLSHGDAKVYTIDKLSLYRSLVVQSFLPRYGYIFMGQRKNIRYYDFVEDTYVVYAKGDLPAHLAHHTRLSQDCNFFVDLFVGEDFALYFAGHEAMVDIIYRDGLVIVLYGGDEYTVSSLFSPTQKMEPYYAMEPNIG